MLSSMQSLSAESPDDYSALSVTLGLFGEVGSQMCRSIDIINDTMEPNNEPNNEIFTVSMTNPVSLLDDVIIQQPTVNVTISDCE